MTRLPRFTVLAALFLIAVPARATTLFFDDFESGGLAPTRWQAGSGGVVGTDPVEGDRALYFNRVFGGGDLLSQSIGSPTGMYVLSFDYLGTCGHQDCGGFIGREPGDVWILGSQPSYPTTSHPQFLLDDGEWHHYSVSFNAGATISLQLEDFVGVARDAWFDNILVTDADGPSSSAPEPGALLLTALGVIALRRARRRTR